MNNKKIQIAKDFINSHKNNFKEAWFSQCNSYSDDDKYIEIYDKLESGSFGECRNNDEFTEFEVEIPANESLNGNPSVFEWDNPVEG